MNLKERIAHIWDGGFLIIQAMWYGYLGIVALIFALVFIDSCTRGPQFDEDALLNLEVSDNVLAVTKYLWDWSQVNQTEYVACLTGVRKGNTVYITGIRPLALNESDSTEVSISDDTEWWCQAYPTTQTVIHSHLPGYGLPVCALSETDIDSWKEETPFYFETVQCDYHLWTVAVDQDNPTFLQFHLTP